MKVDEVIESLEAEVLQLLKDDRRKILKVEVCEEVYMALEMRGYFSLNHRLVSQDWPVQLCQHIDKAYEIHTESKSEIINLFQPNELAIPKYYAGFKYFDI